MHDVVCSDSGCNWFFLYYESKLTIYARPDQSYAWFYHQNKWFNELDLMILVLFVVFLNNAIVDDHDNYLYFVLNCFVVVAFHDSFFFAVIVIDLWVGKNVIYHGQFFHFIYCQLIVRSLTLCLLWFYVLFIWKTNFLFSIIRSGQIIKKKFEAWYLDRLNSKPSNKHLDTKKWRIVCHIHSFNMF